VTLLPLPQILPYEDPRDPTIRGRAVAGHGHISISALPWDLREEMGDGRHRCVKASSTRRVLAFEEEVSASRPMTLFAKRNRARTPLKALGYRLYRSKARREWQIGWSLVRRGFLTGRPVLVAERRRRGLVSESYLITEQIGAQTTLLRHLRERVKERGEDPTELVQALAAFVNRLHAARFYHDDLSAEHIWVNTETNPPRFGLIDLDQARFTPWITRARKMTNLFQILRSVPPKHLLPPHRRELLAAFYGETWWKSATRIEDDLHRLAEAKGARDIL
jgi:tRNA A-37 threonylcarbamoyl transferase component Bud32